MVGHPLAKASSDLKHDTTEAVSLALESIFLSLLMNTLAASEGVCAGLKKLNDNA